LNIIFKSPLKGYISEPKPALQHIPKAYKDLPLFIDAEANPTVKRCVPFLDALTSGYIIPHPTDVEMYYNKDKGDILFTVAAQEFHQFSDLIGVKEHEKFQISPELMHPRRTIDAVFKFVNPWTIITPPGYSCIFITPANHVLPYDLITGIVDTDTYPETVNFPFYWTKSVDQRTLIKEGSPMAMVIPFKRESWKMKTEECKLTIEQRSKRKLSFFNLIADNYKRKFWNKKSFR
tara:strand:+ start:15776 stop:16477 length:702 start_codon:yes stop_codon:yes gene_type:complete